MLGSRRIISNLGINSGNGAGCIASMGTDLSWSSANGIVYSPISIDVPVSVTAFTIFNGSVIAGGHFDMGLYTADGRLLASLGSTAQAGTSVYQTTSISAFNAGPGLYYLAVQLDGTTKITGKAFSPIGFARAMGFLEQLAGGFGLSGNASPATFAASATMVNIPQCGMTVSEIGTGLTRWVQPATVHCHGIFAAGETIGAIGRAMVDNAISGGWANANRATYVPFNLPDTITLTQFYLLNGAGAAAGNVDVGVYSADGRLIIGVGGVAQSNAVANTFQVMDVADTELGPGPYFLGTVCSSTSTTVFRSAGAAQFIEGVQEQATAYPLPATATFSNTISNSVIPVSGFTTRATV
jgi:hypothetical protein